MGLTESLGAPIARRLGWARTFVSLTFVATLLGLGLANIALRATWHEVEDGVLWVTGPQGVTAAEVAPAAPAAQAGVRPGDVLLAIGERPVEQPSEVLAFVHAQSAGTRLRYTVLRLQSPEVVSLALAPLPQGTTALYFVLAAVGHLHAAGRRGRPVPPSQRRSHAALLLVVPGVFRRHHLLVQRPAGSPRLVLLLDRRRVDSAAAAAVPALHAGLSRTPPQLGPHADGANVPAPAVSAGGPARTGPRRRHRALAAGREVLRRRRRGARPLRAALPVDLPRRRPGDRHSRVRARALGDRAAPAALDRVGHGAWRVALRASATRCRTRLASSRRCRWSCRRFRSASSRWRLPRPSSVTG